MNCFWGHFGSILRLLLRFLYCLLFRFERMSLSCIRFENQLQTQIYFFQRRIAFEIFTEFLCPKTIVALIWVKSHCFKLSWSWSCNRQKNAKLRLSSFKEELKFKHSLKCSTPSSVKSIKSFFGKHVILNNCHSPDCEITNQDPVFSNSNWIWEIRR